MQKIFFSKINKINEYAETLQHKLDYQEWDRHLKWLENPVKMINEFKTIVIKKKCFFKNL